MKEDQNPRWQSPQGDVEPRISANKDQPERTNNYLDDFGIINE